MGTAANIAAAFAGLAAAVVALRLSRAPGWRELLPAAIVAGAAGVFGAVAAALADERAAAAAPALAQLRLAFGGAGVAAWVAYAGRELGVPSRRRHQALVGSALLVGALALVPGTAFGPPVVARPYAPLGVVYQDPTPTAFGTALEVWLLALLAAVGLRYARAAVRRRDGGLAAHAAAFAVVVAAGVNDVLAIGGHADVPYLLGLAALAPVAVSTLRLTRRFALEAGTLAELRARLEDIAEERAAQLARADEELERSARLAELGRTAASIGRGLAEPSIRAEVGIERALAALAAGDRKAAADAVADALVGARQIAEVVRAPAFRAPDERR